MNKHFLPTLIAAAMMTLSACDGSNSNSNTDSNSNNLIIDEVSSNAPEGESQPSGGETASSVYRVSGSDLSLSLQSGGENQSAEMAVWNDIVTLLPSQILKDNVAEHHVFTDGVDNTLAYVSQVEGNATYWLFAVDSADSADTSSKEFVKTVVHEFAHIVALEKNEIETGVDQAQCATDYPVAEGCPKDDSYILDWFNQFWKGDLYTDHQAAVGNKEGEAKEQAVADFHEPRKARFVNEYSATDPIEDFAETFAYYVLSDTIENPSSVKEQKIEFFDTYQELIDIRTHVRAQTAVRVTLD